MAFPLLLASLCARGEGDPHDNVLLATGPTTDAQTPSWAHELARRLNTNAASLLADWKEDKQRFPLNATGRVVRRGANSGSEVPLTLAALPRPLASSTEPQNRSITIGVMQMQAIHGQRNESMAKAWSLLNNTPPGNIDLLVLPELAFTGYVWESAAEAQPHAEPVHGPTYQWAHEVAVLRNAHVLVGFLEQGEDHLLHNSAMLVSPSGLAGLVRKTALTDTDAQWAISGSGSKSMPVVDTPFGRVGMGICKDMSAVPAGAAAGEHSMDENFKAAAVDLIAVLAAWDSQDSSEIVHKKWLARVSKHLNTKTLFVVADQSGSELGVPFAGSSTVIDLSGPTPLAAMSEAEEGVSVQVVTDFPLKSGAGAASA